ncbi:MAG: hypothetical protein COB59_09285 [Rhodospirillaceae bacterium]|nr:MAG: hypothetical protein COB59_09285 [Rhodospirillaceae bacterium]
MTVHDDLRQIGQQKDGDINLATAALLLAKFKDLSLDIGPYQRHIDTLVEDCLNYIGDDFNDNTTASETVCQIIAKRYGYTAQIEDDQDAQQHNFAQMIDHRRGSALNLCLLYAHVLEHIGQPIEIIDLEDHPVVRLLGQREHILVDPLQGVKPIGAAQMRSLFKESSPFALKVLDKRSALLNGQDLTKLYLLRNNAPEAAISVLESCLLIAPDEPRLWRELGVLEARLDHIDDSISALKRYLEISESSTYRYSASQLLQELQTRKDNKPS